MTQGFDKKVNPTEKKYVKFYRGCSPYLAGEVGLFPIVASLKLVGGANPIGYYVKKNENGEWVPDKGDENVNDESTNANGSGEQTGTGQEGGAATSPQAGAAASPKAAGQGRRQRAKL